MTQTPPTAYNHYVSIDNVPYIFTTADSADDTAKLCAVMYVQGLEKSKPLLHATWIKWESDTTAPVDRYIDESRYICEWHTETRTVSVSSNVRIRDGRIRSGYTTVAALSTFRVCTVPRFISPLKVKQFFKVRDAAAASAKAALDKAAAVESLSHMIAASAVPAAVPAAAAVVRVVAVTPVPEAPVTPAPPSEFGETMKEFIQ